MKPVFLVAALLLASCGGSSPADNTADQLENAAEQSTPGAAQVLENAADRIEDSEGNVAAEAEACRALEQAGNVAANEQ